MDDNKRIVSRFIVEVMNQGNLDALGDFVAASVQDHPDRRGAEPGGFDAVEAGLAALQEAFPDLAYHVETLVAEGDLVALRGQWSGTHKAPFAGVKATGRRVIVRGMEMFRLEAGKIVEHWGSFDQLGLLQQLGVIPSPTAN